MSRGTAPRRLHIGLLGSPRTSSAEDARSRVCAVAVAALIIVGGCAGSARAPSTPLPHADRPEVMTVDCSRGSGRCPAITIVGDRPSATVTFTGRADPGMYHDPVVPGRIWMLYSYLEGRPAHGRDGTKVGIPHVSTRLARSDDRGRSWRLEGTVWDSPLTRDPEGLGPDSYFGSETPSLVAVGDASGVTWYSVRLSYFLEPVTAYAPRYASSWTMRVATMRGPSPASLGQANEAILGTGTTHAAYGPHVRLTALAPELRDCGMWNNPAIAAEAGRLYVIAECLAFDGAKVSDTRSRMVVFRTTPTGAPVMWRWEYVGVLADHALARALGGERVVSANVSRGADGALLLVLTPHVSGAGQGCAVLLLDSLDPPRIRRDAAGRPLVRARQVADRVSGWHTGACTYDSASETGLVTVAASTARGLQAELRATGLRP